MGWTRGYFEKTSDSFGVQRVYRQEPLNEALVLALNSQVTLEELWADIEEIGYGA